MKKVQRNEILDLGAYEQIRDRFRAAVIEEKKNRRFQISDELSIVFENHVTALFQIQEMLRTERITKESAIQHEIDTYNDLIPLPGQLSGTVFVEIPERETRERRLVELVGLESTFALDVDGELIAARNETRGVLPDRTTAVHYLKFPLSPALGARVVVAAQRASAPAHDVTTRTGDEGPTVRFRVRHPRLQLVVPLPVTVLRAIAEDLDDGP